MQRVLILMKALGRGGAEQLIVNAAPYIDRSRFHYEVAYVTCSRDGLVGELRKSGLEVHCLGNGAGWIRHLRGFVSEHRIDLIHCHSPYVAVGARVAFGRCRPRLVVTEHNVWHRHHPATYWANLLTIARTDYVFAVSDEVRNSMVFPKPLRFLPMPPVETLLQGLDPAAVRRWPPSAGVREDLGIPPNAPVVGTIANFKAHKGLHVLLMAAARVRQHIPNVRFILVGGGPLEMEMRNEAQRLGLRGTVIFAGLRSDAQRIAGAFDVFALSSVAEGLPIALLEVMALGKPVVVTDVGGLPEVVEHGTHGFVVPPRDPVAFADAINTLIADPSLRDRFGAAARQRASDFDIRAVVARMEAVYGNLLSAP